MQAGPGRLSIASGGAHTASVPVEYFESVAVAFGLRPYIAEHSASILLRPDPSVIVRSASHNLLATIC